MNKQVEQLTKGKILTNTQVRKTFLKYMTKEDVINGLKRFGKHSGVSLPDSPMMVTDYEELKKMKKRGK